MNKVIAACVIVLLGTIGFTAYAYTVYLPSLSSSGLGSANSGTLNIYLTDAPVHNATLKYLLVNVTSVTLKYSSNLTETTTSTSSSSSTSSSVSSSTSETTTLSTSSSSSSTNTNFSGGQDESESMFTYNVSSTVGLNVNLTKLQGNQILLGTSKVPAGNVSGIILNITGAEAFWTDGSHTQLKVVADGKLMINVHFSVQSDGTTNLTVDLAPGDVHVSPGNGSVLRPVVHVTALSSGPKGTETVETTETESETPSTTSG